ncbi:MAG: DUF4215 domain-containing protein [Nannocystaceae bacterium]
MRRTWWTTAIWVGLLGACSGDDAVVTTGATEATTDGSSSTEGTSSSSTSTAGTTSAGTTTGGTATMGETTTTDGTTSSTTTSSTTDGTDTDSTGPICEPGEINCVCGPGESCVDPLECVDGVCTATPAVCGDGVVGGDEACDDGNDVDTDACLTTCEAASCGDGAVQEGVEACDDGNDVDTDACLSTCEVASCGDGAVQEGVEACDDGNDVDTDACLTTCEAAACGDGVVQEGVEACDDGNMVDDDACSNACEVKSACFQGKGYLAVASNGGTVFLYEPTNLTQVDSFPGFSGPQSVAAGPNGKLYVGEFSQLRSVDLGNKQTQVLGGGLVSGNLYGTTVYEGKIYASGSGMSAVKVLNLDGSDAGTVASPNGNNLRSTAFGPGGDFYLASFGGGPGQHWGPGLVYDKAFGGGGLSTAFGVATRSNGDVIIASQNNDVYYVYSKDGAFQKSIAVPCVNQIRNLATDCQDSVYVACTDSNKVVRYTSGDAFSAEVAVSSPTGVAVVPMLP